MEKELRWMPDDSESEEGPLNDLLEPRKCQWRALLKGKACKARD